MSLILLTVLPISAQRQFIPNDHIFSFKTLFRSWTRWCNQILSSLHYMHSLNTVHGNLTTETIFLQHHGLLKIGCFSIDTIKTSSAAAGEPIKVLAYKPGVEIVCSQSLNRPIIIVIVYIYKHYFAYEYCISYSSIAIGQFKICQLMISNSIKIAMKYGTE